MMERMVLGAKSWSTILLLSALCLLGTTYSAEAYIANPWAPTQNEDFFAVSVDASSPSLLNYLYIYDWGNPTGAKLQVVRDIPYAGSSIYFTKDDLDWYAGYYRGDKQLLLGNSYLFGFGFSDGTNFFTNYDLTKPSLYQLVNSSIGMTVLTNAAPVPIPAAAILLGSGLLGLVVLRRK